MIPSGRYIYSGTTEPNDEGAIKSTHNEMKGNSSCHLVTPDSLFFQD